MDGNTTLRVLFGLGMGAAACLVVVNGQTPPRPHAFDVASIKENVSGSDNASVRAQPGGRVSVSNNSLRSIIRNAYSVQNHQIVGGPDWVSTVRWDITAKAPEDAPPQQLLLMLRTLLADRFKLVIRNETREMPIYALTLARADGRLGRSCARRIRTALPSSRRPRRKARRHRRLPTAGPPAACVRRAET